MAAFHIAVADSPHNLSRYRVLAARNDDRHRMTDVIAFTAAGRCEFRKLRHSAWALHRRRLWRAGTMLQRHVLAAAIGTGPAEHRSEDRMTRLRVALPERAHMVRREDV